MQEYGLVLEGGGLRGTFTLGVLNYFLDNNNMGALFDRSIDRCRKWRLVGGTATRKSKKR